MSTERDNFVALADLIMPLLPYSTIPDMSDADVIADAILERYELVPKVIEAPACGKPIVLSAYGAAPCERAQGHDGGCDTSAFDEELA
jgi:glycosyltransferase involved in cell wall biosynthesis